MSLLSSMTNMFRLQCIIRPLYFFAQIPAKEFVQATKNATQVGLISRVHAREVTAKISTEEKT